MKKTIHPKQLSLFDIDNTKPFQDLEKIQTAVSFINHKFKKCVISFGINAFDKRKSSDMNYRKSRKANTFKMGA